MIARRSSKLLHSGLIDIGRLRVHHTYGGHGSPVVFIHGLGSSGYMEWRLNLEKAAARHRVFAPAARSRHSLRFASCS